ncbi:nuclear transport factor 2 family protein [Acidaminobacter sp. JC074]|uniref:nuclear transport factor 2 family protein n=1 Tax=Acidaminobacter sp. JC074 TaxID=2530199 RepID=UPI001F0D23A3|nr:nuclear transport factor 2 family protein [Acidaminobacter sp. JC074]MCH4888492.1 nuclear transport factor 2 family protein [Acidaminobacter sp. JC074]
MKITKEYMDSIMTMFNSRDIKGLGEVIHPDIIIRNLDSNSILVQGKKDVIKFYDDAFRNGCSKSTIVGMMTLEDKVVFTEHMKEPDGSEHDEFNMMAFENGLIKRIWFLEE